MPVGLQWIALLAGVLAAGLVLHRLYNTYIAVPDVPLAIERHDLPANGPARAATWDDLLETTGRRPSDDEGEPDLPSASPTFDSPGAAGHLPAPTPDDILPSSFEEPTYVEPVPARNDADLASYAQAEPLRSKATEPVADAVATQPPTSLQERLRESLGDPQELATSFDPEEQPVEAEPPTPLPLPTPSGVIGGVAVRSLTHDGRPLDAEVREVVQGESTLVTLAGMGGSLRTEAARYGYTNDGASSKYALPVESSAVVYVFRVLVASATDSLDPDSHGVLVQGLHVVPSTRSWPGEGLPATSEEVLGAELLSVVELDTLWLGSREEPARSEFVAAVGGMLYEFAVAGARSQIEGWHEIHIGLGHRVPGRSDDETIALDLLVEQDRKVTFRVPEILLARNPGRRALSPVDTVLVALTPLSGAGAELIRSSESFFDPEPVAALLPVTGPSPTLPVDLPHDAGTLGRLRLRLLVLANGEVGSVVAIEAAVPQAELLVEPIVSAVRQWRFHPPAIAPNKLGAYFDVTMGFDFELHRNLGDPTR